jgi:hypothetical protein
MSQAPYHIIIRQYIKIALSLPPIPIMVILHCKVFVIIMSVHCNASDIIMSGHCNVPTL